MFVLVSIRKRIVFKLSLHLSAASPADSCRCDCSAPAETVIGQMQLRSDRN